MSTQAKPSARDYWLPEPPELEISQADEVLEADVIVCGAGVAGVAAAREAVEEGASCILFEKTIAPQARSGQFAVLGGELLKRQWGVYNDDKRQEVVGFLMRDGGYRVKQGMLNHFANHIGEDFDWYLEGLPEQTWYSKTATDVAPKGMKAEVLLMQNPPQPLYDRSSERFPDYPFTVQIRPGHGIVLKGNVDLAEKTGLLRVLYKTPVKKLIRDEQTGRVTGVLAQDYDGKVWYAKARRGVVLSTGDYSGDQQMLERFCPWVADNPRASCGVAPDKSPANTGDGHKMGMWIGAKMESEPHCSNAHNMGNAMGATPFLQLDLNGSRFMNEDCPGSHLENQIARLKGKTAWQFFDAGWPEQVPHMPMGHGTCSIVLDEEAVARGECSGMVGAMDGYASQGFIDKAFERGGNFKADTLEELIALTGLPAETALASILRYNELAEKGCDEDFGKRADRLYALNKPPFYASRITPAALLCCHSGLESDELCHVYDNEMDVIPGLYVAGNVQGNRFSVDYPTTIPGLSHSIALSLGRQAGRSAVQEL